MLPDGAVAVKQLTVDSSGGDVPAQIHFGTSYALKNSIPATEHSSVALGPRAKLRFANACLHPSNPAAHPCAAGKL